MPGALLFTGHYIQTNNFYKKEITLEPESEAFRPGHDVFRHFLRPRRGSVDGEGCSRKL